MKTLERVKKIATPFVFGVVFLALWEGAVNGFNLKPYFWRPHQKLWSNF